MSSPRRCVALPALAAIEQGAKAPEFKAQASLAGKEFTYSLKDELKKGPVVVYFYPSAYTGGCNIQAHTFAENMDKFKAAGATVIGVSLDKIGTLERVLRRIRITAPASCRLLPMPTARLPRVTSSR